MSEIIELKRKFFEIREKLKEIADLIDLIPYDTDFDELIENEKNEILTYLNFILLKYYKKGWN